MFNFIILLIYLLKINIQITNINQGNMVEY